MGALGEQSTSNPASGQGVAKAVAQQSGGHVAVFLLGVGLLLYAAFCVVDALLHHDEKKQAKKWWKRALSAYTAVLYGAFGVYCILTAFSDTSRKTSGEQGRKQTQWTARVLDWPAGQVWLFIAGVALFVAAAVLVVRAAKRKFRKYLEEGRMSPRVHQVAMTVGVIGMLGRAAFYSVIGWFIVKAALEDDPKNGKGFDGSARALAGNDGGATFLWLMAAALACFGVYLVFEAIYRKVAGTSTR